MPHTVPKNNARTRLADALADIRSSRAEQLEGNQDLGPTPAKRRAAVNYVELSGNHTRQSRTSTSRTSLYNSQGARPDFRIHTTPRKRTYRIKLFDRSIDLAKFANADGEVENDGVSLYPLCRDWLHEDGLLKNHRDHDHPPPPHLMPSDQASGTQPSDYKSPIGRALRKNDKIDSSNSPSGSSTPDLAYENAPVADVHGLPPPISNAAILERFGLDSEKEDADIRIPPMVRQFKRASDLERSFDKTFNTMARHECLQINRERWRGVKKNWSDTNKIHGQRYEDSFKILNDIFKSQSRDN